MKYAGFKYDYLNNIGDHIQSLAAEQFLPKVDLRINRDTLSINIVDDPILLVMNGWFSHTPGVCFPPGRNIIGLFWGFHITNWNNSWEYVLKPPSLNYLKKCEPIGCRDIETMKRLKEAGIDSFYSKCLTLTFPKRMYVPKKGMNILVDADNIPLPASIKENSLSVSHKVPRDLSEKIKFIYARHLLHLYKEQAKLVITTRLHCALPCLAMGIPVIFFGNEKDYRISLLKDVGLKIHTISAVYRNITDPPMMKTKKTDVKIFQEKVDWNPEPIDFEEEKDRMINSFKRMLNETINKGRK